MNDTNSSNEIQEKLEKIKNLNPESPGLLRANELYQIIKVQMDLTTALFEQQHKDIQKLSKSSKKLEILTGVLIWFTVILVVKEIFPFFVK